MLLLLWSGYGPAAPHVNDVAVTGYIALSSYPSARVTDQSPVSSLLASDEAPFALLSTSILLTRAPTSTLDISPAVPTATIKNKEHA